MPVTEDAGATPSARDPSPRSSSCPRATTPAASSVGSARRSASASESYAQGRGRIPPGVAHGGLLQGGCSRCFPIRPSWRSGEGRSVMPRSTTGTCRLREKLGLQGILRITQDVHERCGQGVYKKGRGAVEMKAGGERQGGRGLQPRQLDIEEVARRRVSPRDRPSSISFPQAMMWAVIGTPAGFAVTFVRERQGGDAPAPAHRPAPDGRRDSPVKALGCFLAGAPARRRLTAHLAHFILGMRIREPGALRPAASSDQPLLRRG